MGVQEQLAEAEAKVALLKAEARFVSQKESSGGATVKQKLAIRETRFKFRTRFPTAGTVNPATVAGKVKVGK